MDQILRTIRDAKCASDLYQALNALLNETVRVVSARPINKEQAHQVAQYLGEIRLLLHTMARSDARPVGNGVALTAERLAALYGEIEGRVKEIRNDLAGEREGKRH